jgi:hypothetical protein
LYVVSALLWLQPAKHGSFNPVHTRISGRVVPATTTSLMFLIMMFQVAHKSDACCSLRHAISVIKLSLESPVGELSHN